MEKLLGPIGKTKIVIYPASDVKILKKLDVSLTNCGYDVSKIIEEDFEQDFEKLLSLVGILYKFSRRDRLTMIMGSNMDLKNVPWDIAESAGGVLTGYKFISWLCSNLDRSIVDFTGILMTKFEEDISEYIIEDGTTNSPILIDPSAYANIDYDLHPKPDPNAVFTDGNSKYLR